MTCDEVKLGDGFTAIVCTRGRRRRASTCSTPGCSKPAAVLCDHPVMRNGKEATCDRALCEGHAVAISSVSDYCEAHARHSRVRPFDRRLFMHWCAYFWRTEMFDRTLPGEKSKYERDCHIPHPNHRYKSEEHARKVLRELQLGPTRGTPEHEQAKALSHHGVCTTLREAGWTSRGIRLFPPRTR